MSKRDILTPIGITFGFIIIIFAILSSGQTEDLISFIDIASIFIVLGGVIASMLINFKLNQLKLVPKLLKAANYQNNLNLNELIHLFTRLSERARREGILALENELDEVEDPFLRKGILLVVDGVEPEVIKDILEAEIIAMEDRHEKGQAIFLKAGEYAPAWGMIGTLVGLVLMLNRMQDPALLGPSMAVALITTLYGTVLANLVFLPMASKLEGKTDEEVFFKQIIIEGIIGVQSGQNPRILEEKLNAFLSKEEKAIKDEEESFEALGESVNEA